MSKSGKESKTGNLKNLKNVIGNYRMEKTIGEGTFGKVKIGIHLPTEEKVAIKILEKEKIQDKEDLDRITREINFLKKLKHQNIIKIYEIVENTKSFYIIMEYAPGGELFNHIVKKRRLEEMEASFFFVQILNGLEYIHKNNIVHRDMKPENLLLTENNNLKIIDFGLSNTYKTGQLLQTPCGSPCYAAPEMILGRKYSGLMVDIWSTGIILFAMVCGYLPFEDKNNDRLYKKILDCKLDFPDHVSNICRDLMKRILTVNPSKRITLEELKSHSFLKAGQLLFKKEENSQNTDRAKISEGVVEKMIDLGFDKTDVYYNIEHNKHNNVTTTYELLLNKYKFTSLLTSSSSEKSEKNKSDNLKKGNINININCVNKIGNINIHINEKNEPDTNTSDNNSEKVSIKDNLESQPQNQEVANKIKIRNSGTINNNLTNNTISSFNTSPERSTKRVSVVNTVTTVKNKPRISTSLNKADISSYHKSSTSTYSQTNRELRGGSKDVNDSISLDIQTLIQNNKVEGNNLILGANMIPPINKINNKFNVSKYSDANSTISPKNLHSGRTMAPGNVFSRKINTSISVEKNNDLINPLRTQSKEIKFQNNNIHTIASKFVPSNTIDLTKNDLGSSINNKNHKNSYSITVENNYKRSSSASEGNKNLTEVGKTSRLSTGKKEFDANSRRKTISPSTKLVSGDSTNTVSEFNQRLKNLSIADVKFESPSLMPNFFISNENSSKFTANLTTNPSDNLVLNTQSGSNSRSNTQPNENNSSKKASSKNKNKITYQSFKSLDKKMTSTGDSTPTNAKLNANKKPNDLNRSGKEISNYLTPKHDRDSSTKRKSSPGPVFAFQKQFNKRVTSQNQPVATPVTTVTLMSQSTSHNSTNSNAMKTKITPMNKKIDNEVGSQQQQKGLNKKLISAKNFNSKTTSINKVSNNTPISSKYDKFLKSSTFKISNNFNNNSPTQHKTSESQQEDDLVFNLGRNQTDFACCTISGSSASTVNLKLKDYCQNNSLNIKEIKPDLFECSKDDNVILLEMTHLGNSKIMKLQHLNGIESITKDIIKHIIINIGF